jgi:exonuclease SbcC
MKIHSVKFSNLNSLRDEVDIDFVNGSLGAAGLFAITGPTGSGKSTILDAISLALYGTTARNQKQEIISRGSRKAESAVEFEIKGQLYRSTWSMRLSKPKKEGKAPTGTPSMELALVDRSKEGKDSILGEKKSLVPRLVEELTGLNFIRFTQSMLLAQGQFDAFLVAPTKDRSDLLEQITGTQIYSDVSRLVYNRHKDLALTIDARQKELEKRGVPTEEEIEKLKEEEAKNAGLVQDQLEPIKMLRVVHQAHQEFSLLKKRKVQLAEEENEFTSLATHRAAVQTKLDANQRALPLVADLRSLELQQTELKKVSQAHEEAQATLPELKTKVQEQKSLEASAKTEHQSATANLQKVQIILEQLKHVQEVLAKAKKEKEVFEKSAQQQQIQIEEIASRQSKLQDEQRVFVETKKRILEKTAGLASYANLETELPKLRVFQQGFISDRQACQQVEKAWAEVEAEGASIKKSLQNHLQTSPAPQEGIGKEAVDIEHRLDLLNKEVNDTEKFVDWLGDIGARLKYFIGELAAFEERKTAFYNQQKELDAKGALLAKAKQALGEIDIQFKKLVEDEKLANEAFQAIKLTAELRETHLHTLVDGQPCPLCGALEHPALNNLLDAKPAAHEQAWVQAKNKLAQQQLTYEEANKKAAKFEVEIAALTDVNTAKDINDQQQKMDRLSASLSKELQKKSLRNISFDEQGIETLRNEYQNAHQKLKNAQDKFAEMKVLAKAWANYQQELMALKARETDQTERSQKTKAKLDAAKLKLESSKQILSQELNKIGLSIPELIPDNFVDSIQERVDALKKLEAELQLIITKETASIKELKGLVEQLEALEKAHLASSIEVKKQTETLEQKQAQQTKLLAGFESSEALLSNANLTFEQSKAELNQATENLIATTKKIEAIKLQQAERSKKMDELKSEISSLTAKLEASVKARSFDSVEQALASLLEEAQQESLQAEMNKAARKQAELETRKKSLASDEAGLALKLDKQPEADKIAEDLKALEQLHARSQEALGGARKELKRAIEDQKAMERDAAEIAKQLEELADWTTLNGLIGSSSGSKFREYAQRVTLQQLIAYANEYLKEFYPRFSVSSGEANNTDPLEIFICDHYEADQVRRVVTVSGGERFLVSMALALGFSRMASRNISIDTLFIDEGFGTLDGETLDKAIQALEKLQQRGKTIGIISHVASLQERIGAQIRLIRQSSGRSKVEIIG